ncbi:MAG: VWA domain-containing protein [Verrucomicrobiales bacterium]
MPDHLTFAQPAWLLLIAALVPLAFLRYRSQRYRQRAIAALVAPRLMGRLLLGNRPGAHWGRFTLQLCAMTCLCVALAGPRYGTTEEETITEGRNLLIGIDTSRSMLATDLRPDRLTRAKLAAIDLIAAFPADRIGLIAFAGTGFLQAPLTVDHEAVIESIQQIDSEIIPRGGTDLGKALRLAHKTFDKAGSTNNALILFSDGEDLEGDKILEVFAAESGSQGRTLVIAVGVGTTTGAIIPDPDAQRPGEFIRDREGNIVRSRLDPVILSQLADATGGIYLDLDTAGAMREVVARALEELERTAHDANILHKPIERFRWALTPGILFFLLSMIPSFTSVTYHGRQKIPLERPGGPAAAAGAVSLGMLFTLCPAPASEPEQTAAPAGDPWELYQAGDYQAAFERYQKRLENLRPLLDDSYRLHYGAGSSAYQLGDYAKAAESFGRALLSKRPETRERSHYGLGNALYREGEARLEKPEDALLQWRSSVGHYQAALNIDPEDEDASHNLEIVRKRIEEIERQQQQQMDHSGEGDEDQENDDKKESESGEDSSENEDQQQPQDGKDSPQGEDSDPSQSKDQQQKDGSEGEQKPEPEPVEEQEMPEGELGSNRDQPQPAEAQEGLQGEQPHPETGFTPSEARQLLRSLAEEDLDVRPLLPPSRGQPYKNW